MKNRHPHIIYLLASYTQYDAHYLILPLAETDLLGYWKDYGSETDRASKLIWLAKQCQGLAEGLSWIHRYDTVSVDSLLHHTSFPLQSLSVVGRADDKDIRRLYGRHGDIRPENILWFPEDSSYEGGVLKISDFGSAEFSTRQQVDRQRRGFSTYHPTYRPPEASFPLKGGPVSASYDIWTLGCVYLEFLTWWFGGWSKVAKFRDDRLSEDPSLWGAKKSSLRSDAFFTIDVDESTKEEAPRVKPQVTKVSSPRLCGGK